ncbi:MAG: hypothetical protein M1313_00650 [Nitrospirae bacterium]|nr:hypothetical protein [Nitrospirota bacterium]
MGNEGRRSREDRLKLESSGTWVSSSTDFTILLKLLYLQSKNYSKSVDGNCSPYVLCAIPMIFSALRCLMIEYESVSPPNRTALKVLTEPNDFLKMLDHYKVTGQLLKEANLLNEIRNEIVHPAHLPTGTPDNWPEYLQEIKKMGLLQSTGKVEADYAFFAQMSSHKLFSWACCVAQDIAACIVKSDSEKFKIKGRFTINFQEINSEK